MNIGRTVFSQLLDLLPKYEFDKAVKRYNGNYKSQSFSCWEQYLTMCFAQLTYRESLRDIESCLQAVSDKLTNKITQCAKSGKFLGIKQLIINTKVGNFFLQKVCNFYVNMVFNLCAPCG